MVSRESGKVASTPRLTIIIPVYNERETLPKVLEKVNALPVEKQVIVVDNFSTDGTREYLRSLSPTHPEVEVLFNPRNLGKGASVRRGIGRAKGKFVAVQDADLEYDPRWLLKLLEEAEGRGCQAAFGSRVLGLREGLWRLSSGRGAMGRLEQAFYMGARVFFWLLTRFLFGRGITDPATGHKLLQSDLARSLRLRSTGFELDFEVSAKVLREKVRFCEVPIPFRPRGRREGKKIRLLDLLRGIRAVVAVRMGRI